MLLLGGVATAQRCDTVIPTLPLSTTKITQATCSEGTLPPELGRLTNLEQIESFDYSSLSGAWCLRGRGACVCGWGKVGHLGNVLGAALFHFFSRRPIRG